MHALAPSDGNRNELGRPLTKVKSNKSTPLCSLAKLQHYRGEGFENSGNSHVLIEGYATHALTKRLFAKMLSNCTFCCKSEVAPFNNCAD